MPRVSSIIINNSLLGGASPPSHANSLINFHLRKVISWSVSYVVPCQFQALAPIHWVREDLGVISQGSALGPLSFYHVDKGATLQLAAVGNYQPPTSGSCWAGPKAPKHRGLPSPHSGQIKEVGAHSTHS